MRLGVALVLLAACGSGGGSPPDGPVADARATDAASDAAPHDAPTADAHVIDAMNDGGADAATADAATADAATADANTDAPPDASPDAAPDASPDATPPCTVDTDCPGDHTVCLVSTSPHTCGCAAGYTANGAGDCTWTGVIANAGFSDATAWSLACGVTLDTTTAAPGLVDPGFASLRSDACIPVRLDQPIEMPRRSRAEPLVFSVRYRQVPAGPLSYTVSFPALGLNTIWHVGLSAAADANGWVAARQCLGAREYAPESTTGRGAVLPVGVMFELPYSGDTSEAIDIDRVEILPANPGECPDVGFAFNGDAEAAGGWSLSTSGATGSAAIVAGVGENGTRGVELHSTPGCIVGSYPVESAVNAVSIPLDVPSPALAFYSAATTGAVARVSLGINDFVDPMIIPPLVGTGGPQTTHICIPAFMRGSVRRFAAQLVSGPGSCNVDTLDAVFDNLAIVNDPTCGTATDLTNASFESPNPLLDVASNGGTVTTVQDATLAHTGMGALALALGACPATASAAWTATVLPPSPTATAGPALAFYYKVATLANVTLTVGSVTATKDNQWHRAVTCLDPKVAGRPQVVRFAYARNAANCNQPVSTAYLDDLALTTDPSCPTQ